MLYKKIIKFRMVTVSYALQWAASHHSVVNYFPITARPLVFYSINIT